MIKQYKYIAGCALLILNVIFVTACWVFIKWQWIVHFSFSKFGVNTQISNSCKFWKGDNAKSFEVILFTFPDNFVLFVWSVLSHNQSCGLVSLPVTICDIVTFLQLFPNTTNHHVAIVSYWSWNKPKSNKKELIARYNNTRVPSYVPLINYARCELSKLISLRYFCC